jgi:hypothetical protein
MRVRFGFLWGERILHPSRVLGLFGFETETIRRALGLKRDFFKKRCGFKQDYFFPRETDVQSHLIVRCPKITEPLRLGW